MLFSRLLTLLLLFSLLLAGACSQQTPLAATGQGKPALWQVTGTSGHRAYIFGTVHLLPPGTIWHTPVIETAIQQSGSLVTEVTSLDNKAAVAKTFTAMSASPGLPPLEKRVPPELVDTLDNALDDAGTPAEARGTLESWAAAMAIASAVSDDLGMEASSGVEPILQSRFRTKSKPHYGLETIARQFGYFDQLPEAEQRQLLTATLRGTKNARTDMQKMLDYWMRGDVDALLKNSESTVLSSPELRATLLDNRNRAWADKIAKMIDQGRAPFVAVGAAHVAGPCGLPALLKAKGYKIERIQ
jgi:uncharacterized protein